MVPSIILPTLLTASSYCTASSSRPRVVLWIVDYQPVRGLHFINLSANRADLVSSPKREFAVL